MDEGRPETLYELEIAFAEIEKLDDNDHRPWAVDRASALSAHRHHGQHHRSEFCIDKLYNPDALRGRLGLLELRAFEMPPHAGWFQHSWYRHSSPGSPRCRTRRR